MLGRAIDCSHCDCRFVVMRDSKVVALDDLPQVTFSCPRCRTSGSMAKLLASRGTACTKCKLPLYLGPDHRLHSAEEAAELRKAIGGKTWRRPKPKNPILSFLTTVDGNWRYGRLLVCLSCLSVLLVAAAIQLQKLFDSSPTTLAKHAVRLCLAGDARRAERYLDDNAVQLVEFERWHLRHLSSLKDAYRPEGDRANIDVVILEDGAESKTLEVAISSESIGTRKYKMDWQLSDGHWVFDAFGTLSAEDKPIAKSEEKRQRPKVPGKEYVIPNLVPTGP
jgi:hypothetical protein